MFGFVTNLKKVAKIFETSPRRLLGYTLEHKESDDIFWKQRCLAFAERARKIRLECGETFIFKMPVLCMFYGIIVRMYREIGGKHNMPHIHAEYSGQEVVVALDGTVLEGKLPKSQMKLLDAWMEIHKDDLAANWKLLSNGEQFFRIDPLK